MASGNFSSNTGTNLNLYVTWSSTTNVSTNTSTVTVNVYSRSYTINGNALADSYVTVNGNTKSLAGISLSQSVTNLTNKLLATHTVTVPHNSDGTKSITIKANIEFNGTVTGKYLSDITASQTITLDTIPRASRLSVPTSINTGSSLTATIAPASTAFTHKIAYIIGNTTMFTSGTIAAGTKTYAYTIPHSWLPSSTSANMVIRLFTYNGSTQIGITDKTVAVSVPLSIKATVSNLTATIVDGLGGYYVEGKSKVKLTATATAGSGSTLSSYVFSGPNISGNSSTYTTTNSTVTSGVIKSVGSVVYGVIAKDKRSGRDSAKKTISITVHEYSSPQITSITAQRCLSDGTLDSNGTYAKVTVKTSYSSINGANKRTVTLYNSKDNYANGTVILSESNTNSTYIGVYGSGFELGTNYTIRAVIEDVYNTSSTISKSVTLGVAERTLNISKYGNGLAIGGLSTITSATASGLFECNWGTKFAEGVNIDNSTDEYLTITRRGMSKDINNDNINETVDIRGQLYVGSGGDITCRKRYKLSTDTSFITQNYWQLRDSDFFVNADICSSRDIYTNSKTNAYDGNQGVCINSNGRIYLTGTTNGKTGAINPYKPGVMFAYDNSTSATSSIIETASGELTLNCTSITTGNVVTTGKFGSNSSYDSLIFAMYCKWKDNANHDILNRDVDGLTTGIGWSGSSTYPTVLNLRGRTVTAPNNSGVAVTSDERLKNSFIDLDKYETFFDKLNPVAFKYNDGSSGRFHVGFGAQSVEQALIESGLNNTDFGGILRYPVSNESEYYHGYDEEYGLIYNEFIALNTHMIQKLTIENKELKSEISILKDKLDLVLSEVEKLKGE